MNKVLLVDDNESFAQSTQSLLELIDYEVKTASCVADAQKAIENGEFSHLILDLMLPDGSGLNVIEGFSEEQIQNTSITIVTGHPAIKTAVKSMFGSSINYLIKPISFSQLKQALESRQEAQPKTPPPSKSPHESFELEELLVGASPAIEELRKEIKIVSKTRANVFINGESGVGKEVVANAIHRMSTPDKPLVAINCGAFNREMITSELFGHEKGSFTGATDKKKGVFERAHGGTLFLDEVTEMPIDMQPTLLRALETQTINRLGGAELIDAKCRVISASNVSESELAMGNKLREDVYFRLAVYPIYIPPLRERDKDAILLAQKFLDDLNEEHGTEISLDSDGKKLLSNYSWPGNVRELKHVIHRSYIRTESAASVLAVPAQIGSPFDSHKTNNTVNTGRRLDEVEKELVLATLERFDGDKQQSAKVLGVSVKTLYNRIKAYEASDSTNSTAGDTTT